jgi:hypothetical protein
MTASHDSPRTALLVLNVTSAGGRRDSSARPGAQDGEPRSATRTALRWRGWCREVGLSLEEAQAILAALVLMAGERKGNAAFAFADLLSRRELERPCETLVHGREKRRHQGVSLGHRLRAAPNHDDCDRSEQQHSPDRGQRPHKHPRERRAVAAGRRVVREPLHANVGIRESVAVLTSSQRSPRTDWLPLRWPSFSAGGGASSGAPRP